MFLFFQAEDGIRDYKVTGVQTCALPICLGRVETQGVVRHFAEIPPFSIKIDRWIDRAQSLLYFQQIIYEAEAHQIEAKAVKDRKSTRLNSSHLVISYAVFCLKKKKKTQQ